MAHPALTPGRGAVITGAASGIGLATATRLAAMGLKVVLADLPGAALDAAAESVAKVAKGGKADVRAVPTDVCRHDQVAKLREAAFAAFGDIAFVMNNAGIEATAGSYDDYAGWEKVLSVNLWGVINGVHEFAPALIAQQKPALIVNTGSKQGITTPPGNTAYNVSKAGVKVTTEALAHALRNEPGCRVTAHLMIPGFVFTGMTARGRTEKPADAWTPEQAVDFMMESLERGDFYILCPDGAVTREMDERRMEWAANDIIQNRPALSRWHPDYKDAFDAFMKAPRK
ncbi:SDR family NAD(P)-dependent oxidoreductase [Dongia sedimenti]|uniref:SDR family NAD(P)-dependent oxidoreductase n=1 Tax=Dongia sedimenti TaxID=3064282 RepID=A0ABU0YHM1_9PROT|nr:SDR family NAD(P)-dependent oxidoreductase [Rhodospirillaceae bacterium R-7]